LASPTAAQSVGAGGVGRWAAADAAAGAAIAVPRLAGVALCAAASLNDSGAGTGVWPGHAPLSAR